MCPNPVSAITYHKGSRSAAEKDLVPEEPLVIRVEGEPYVVIMRTPGQEVFHAAGFCLSEGLVESRDDFASIGHCPNMDPNVVEVHLTERRREKVADILCRRGFVSQTSCGICGKQMAGDICQNLLPAPGGFCLSPALARGLVSALHENQPLYGKTRGAHGVMLFDEGLEALCGAEDVGRHNALDKAVGQALMTGSLPHARVAVLSSRISYEMVLKAGRARLPVVVALSRPTALAVELARGLGMALARVSRDGAVTVYSGFERFERPS